VCYLKGFVSVYFWCPAKTVGFSGTRLYPCIYNQPTATMGLFTAQPSVNWATADECFQTSMGMNWREWEWECWKPFPYIVIPDISLRSCQWSVSHVSIYN